MKIRRHLKRILISAVVFVLLLAGGGTVYSLRQAHASVSFPVATARQSDFLVIIRCRGEVKARRSAAIYAPVIPGLRISWLAPPGEAVKAGDPIIRFDSSTSQQQLAQKVAQLKQSEASLDQWVAQARITTEQDKSDLADAQFSVEIADANAVKAGIKSRLDGEAALIDKNIAQQKLKVQQAAGDLHAAADKAKLASLTRVRDQAKADVDLMRSRIAQMELKAPIAGFLAMNLNYSGVMSSSDAKPYKVGDNVYSGMALGEIPDLTTLEIEARIEETDRARVAVHQEVRLHIDALPELALPAHVDQISPMAEVNMSEYPFTRNFRAYASIPHPDARLRPAMNGGMDIVVNRLPNAISIPAKALFTRAGKPVVYLASGRRYRTVEVTVQARNPDEVAISGISPGSTVALVDLEKKEQKK